MDSWVRKIPWRRDRLPTPVFLGFLGGLECKESACNVGDLGLIPGLGRSPGRGHGNPLQYSCLGNPHGQRSLEGYSPWGHKEQDTTEQLSTAHMSLMLLLLLSHFSRVQLCETPYIPNKLPLFIQKYLSTYHVQVLFQFSSLCFFKICFLCNIFLRR